MTTAIFQDVEKYYGKTQVIPPFNLQINSSEFVVMIGPSGSGKSTLLRMLSGLEEISNGKILLGGQELKTLSQLERNIAMVFQNYALYPHMSVFANMSLGLKLRKYSASEIKKQVLAISDMLDINDLLNRKPAALSGGQQQRVAIGRALVRKPSLCLFDEPLSNLDVSLRSRMRIELKEIHDKLQNTVVYVTHDQVEAMTLADRIIVLNEGRIEQDGTPTEIFEKPKNLFVAQIMGSPTINILHNMAAILQSASSQEENQRKMQVLYPEGYSIDNLIIGVRSEDIKPVNAEEKQDSKLYFNGEICFTELLAGTTNLHIRLATQEEVICSVQGISHYHVGDVVSFAIENNYIHWFDKQTQERI